MARAQIIAIASPLDGVGKTTLAYEVASAFHWTLVDFDWATESARARVCRESQYDGAHLGRALSGDPSEGLTIFSQAPTAMVVDDQPALLAGRLSTCDGPLTPDQVSHQLVKWSRDHLFGVGPMVIDTTAACPELMAGAIAAANLLAMPVRVDIEALGALNSALDLFDLDIETVLVPNFVTSAFESVRADLESIALDIGATIGPQLSYHPCLVTPSAKPLRYLQLETTDVRLARDEFLAIAGALSTRLGK